MGMKQYKAFVASVEEGSISKAGIALGLTQSAVTHLIASLEQELGFSLMKRTKSGISLTPEGSRVLPVMKDVLKEEKRLFDIAESIKGRYSNVIRIGTFTSVAVNWLPSIIKEYSKIRPEITFSITDGDEGELLEKLESGSLDLGFVPLPCDVKGKCLPLCQDRILAVVPKNYELSDKMPISRFETEDVISLKEDADSVSREIFKRYGIKPNVKYMTTDDYAMLAMVENNMGICLAPELLVKGRTQNVKTLPLSPDCYRTIGLLVPFEDFANKKALDVANFICDWVAEHQTF